MKYVVLFTFQLFFLEEQVERKDFECACKIQSAWKKFQLAKKALEQRALVANIFRGKKERQRQSLNRPFVGDYINYDINFSLQEIIQKSSSKTESKIPRNCFQTKKVLCLLIRLSSWTEEIDQREEILSSQTKLFTSLPELLSKGKCSTSLPEEPHLQTSQVCLWAHFKTITS